MATKKKKKKTSAPSKPASKKAAAKKTAKKTAAKKTAKKATNAKGSAKAAAPKAKGVKVAKVEPSVVHWEIQSQMPQKLQSFYSEVFGWKIEANNPMKYGLVASARPIAVKGPAGETLTGINGGIGDSDIPGSRVTVYAGVASINDTLSRIERAGGETVMPRTDIGMVIMAIYKDPEGNLMGLVEG